MKNVLAWTSVLLLACGRSGSTGASPEPARSSVRTEPARAPTAAEPPSDPPSEPAASRNPTPATAQPGGPTAPQPSADPSAATGTTRRVIPPPEALTERAPERFIARLETTEGPIRIEVRRAWAPHGADRFYNLVRAGYYDDVAFFRVLEGFVAQAGIHGDPRVNAVWREATIPDDPVVQSNVRGTVAFAMAGPGTRTTQFFISYGDNRQLDAMGFAPFGRVLDMTAADRLHAGYGEGAPRGQGPDQSRIQREGNEYLRRNFPELDYIVSARIE
ncbi:MAG: peptidylprolyl isomerase [Myxococcota bacterium]|nr:peptidylprolyl isomerase [Myxococcota bacterium]MDW8361154.1 peptidylprolyl isomerase [Myxococcales bacterium]